MVSWNVALLKIHGLLTMKLIPELHRSLPVQICTNRLFLVFKVYYLMSYLLCTACFIFSAAKQFICMRKSMPRC